MIVVEGVDLTGKTTLVNAIGRTFNMQVRTLGRPPIGIRHWDQAVEAIKGFDWRSSIFDRLVIGSVIYGNYLNDEFNYKPVTVDELNAFMKTMYEKNVLLIWARCEIADLRVRYGSRGDQYLTLAQIEDIHVLYERMMYNLQRTYPYFLRFDSTKWATEKWIEAYRDELKVYSY